MLKPIILSQQLDTGEWLNAVRVITEDEVVIPVIVHKAVTVITDCSGSMSRYMVMVREGIKSWISNDLTAKDSFNLVWFSTSGKIGEPIRPTLIPDGFVDPVVSQFADVIDREIYARNLTGFDTPLNQYVTETLPYYNSMSVIYGNMKKVLFFISDGYNNTGDIRKAFAALTEAKKTVDEIYIIGFTEESDERMLKEMARISNGVYLYMEDVESLTTGISTLLRNQSQSDFISIPFTKSETEHSFIFDGAFIKPILNSEPELRINAKSSIITISPAPSAGAIRATGNQLLKEKYALVAGFIDNNRIIPAISFANTEIQDIGLLEEIMNSTTRAQYASLIAKTINLANDETQRFSKGIGQFEESSKIDMFSICGYLSTNLWKFVPIFDDYDHVGISVKRYAQFGDVINGVPFPRTEKITEPIPFKLDSFAMDTMNVTIKVNKKERLYLFDEDKDAFGGANYVELVNSKNYAIINNGKVNIKNLHVIAPNEHAAHDAYKKGIIPMNAIETVIQLSKHPVVKLDWRTETVSFQKFAETYIKIQFLKLEKSLYSKYAKIIRTESIVVVQRRFNEEQEGLLKTKYFVNFYATGGCAVDTPVMYHESLGWDKMPSAEEIRNSETDFNPNLIEFKVNATLLGSKRGKKLEPSFPALNETYFGTLESRGGNELDQIVSDLWLQLKPQLHGMNPQQIYTTLKTKESVVDDKLEILLQDYAQLKSEIFYHKKTFDCGKELKTVVDYENRKISIEAEIQAKIKYVGEYKPIEKPEGN